MNNTTTHLYAFQSNKQSCNSQRSTFLLIVRGIPSSFLLTFIGLCSNNKCVHKVTMDTELIFDPKLVLDLEFRDTKISQLWATGSRTAI